MDDFVISGNYQGYVFVGWASGQMEPRNGGTEKIPYNSMYVLSPVSSFQRDDYHAAGFKAEKKRCIGPQVWEGFKPGDRVILYFDDKGRVIQSALDE